MTLDDNIMMFVSNIRAVFLNNLNVLCVLFPFRGTSEFRDIGIVMALIKICPRFPLFALVNLGMSEGRGRANKAEVLA